MILSAQSIRRRVGMVTPFRERTIAHGMSYGLGPSGYDIRIDRTLIMWPKRFVCADSIERFNIPIDLKPNVQDKSSWKRKGLSVGNTTMEPGWRGILRLELVNDRWWFFMIRAGAPIAQIEFNLLDEPTELVYDGKYQDQGHNQDAIEELQGTLDKADTKESNAWKGWVPWFAWYPVHTTRGWRWFRGVEYTYGHTEGDVIYRVPMVPDLEVVEQDRENHA